MSRRRRAHQDDARRRSYVELKYDSALRLTNEVYYTNSVAQTTNSYGYDVSGSRMRLVKGNATLTNSVSSGYRVTEVKQGSTTVETYAYDNGGRETTMIEPRTPTKAPVVP